MILQDTALKCIHKSLIREPDNNNEFHKIEGMFGIDPDESMINPASIDIRVGHTAKLETQQGWRDIDLRNGPLVLRPGEFVLVATYEWFSLPLDIAVDLRLKSSRAREGWNHSLAFYVDPGWNGILTMELMNALKYGQISLEWKMRIAQVIAHRLECPVVRPYNGKYANANSVEMSKT